MDDLETLVAIAPRLGVSRQAIDQALARADPRPMPALSLTSGTRLYRISEIEAWWKERTEKRWHEARRRGEAKAIQMNVRISPADLEILDRLRDERETRSAAAHRILVAALRAGG